MRLIIQAPIGSIATPELAAGVANAGGMGALGLTWTPIEQVATKVLQVQELTDGPFYVNFALAFEPLGLGAALDSGAKVITFSWGMPSREMVQLVRRHGATFGIQVTNRQGAHVAQDLGASFLIAQGVEAGGHVQGTRPWRRILDEILPGIDIPVAVAGGISTRADVVSARDAGADAVVVGTRFLASPEADVHPEYQRLLLETSETALTNCFQDGWPQANHRVLRNSTLESWEAAGCPAVGMRPGEGDAVGQSGNEPIFRYEDVAPRKGFMGDIEAMCLYAGTGVGNVRRVESAADIVRELSGG